MKAEYKIAINGKYIVKNDPNYNALKLQREINWAKENTIISQEVYGELKNKLKNLREIIKRI